MSRLAHRSPRQDFRTYGLPNSGQWSESSLPHSAALDGVQHRRAARGIEAEEDAHRGRERNRDDDAEGRDDRRERTEARDQGHDLRRADARRRRR